MPLDRKVVEHGTYEHIRRLQIEQQRMLSASEKRAIRKQHEQIAQTVANKARK
ncbi:MAG: hypothetical protein KAV00_06790 [Phycisphaerae bacterium]|nr:hypothetical protein [Phycisphaerae bacterium]